MTRTNTQPADNTSPEAGSHAEPVEKVTFFPVEAAIWKNVSRGGDPFYSVTFERKYKDQEKWKSTASFGGDDLLLLAKVADLAHSRLVELRAQNRQMKNPTP